MVPPRTSCGSLVVVPLLLIASAGSVPAVEFVDVTDEIGLQSAAHGYLAGANTEARKIATGVAVGDYDGDGWPDLYTVRGDVGANQLFRNLGDGTFQDVAAAAGVAIAGAHGCGPVFADYDGDGWLDLFIGGIEGTTPRLFRNAGDGTFVEATGSCGIAITADTFSATFGDPDRDGDLDLLTTHWNVAPGSGHLWRNDGNGTFSVVDDLVGLVGFQHPVVPLDYTFTGNFADIDGDGWSDVLLAADFMTSHVFLNDGDGTFSDATNAVITDENGMGAAIADYDDDGDLDWFVSSIWDSTGPSPGWGSTGNRLYRNSGNGTFEDVTDAAGVRHGYWGWGSSFADLDNDGDLDLYHVNGWYEAQFVVDPARLFLSNGDGTFTESSSAAGVDHTGQGRGVACFDYDKDGDLDVFIANNASKHVLYRNEGNANHWLSVKLVEPGANTEGIGARIRATVEGTTRMRELRAGCNFVSQEPALAHFGLGGATAVDELRIDWTDGSTSVLHDVAADQYLVVDRSTVGAAVGRPPAAGAVRLLGSSPNPFRARTVIRFRLAAALPVRLRIYDARGRQVRALAAGVLPEGPHAVVWDGRDGGGRPVAPGVYFYELAGGDPRARGKVVRVR